MDFKHINDILSSHAISNAINWSTLNRDVNSNHEVKFDILMLDLLLKTNSLNISKLE